MDIKEKITDIVISVIKEIGEENDNKALRNVNLKTRLYGKGGHLDSLSLVRLISGIEEKISADVQKDIVIVDENIISRQFSPFTSVSSLVSYIDSIISR